MKIVASLLLLLLFVQLVSMANSRRSTNLQQALQSIEKSSHYKTSNNWGLPSSSKEEEEETNGEADVLASSSSSCNNETATTEKATTVSRMQNKKTKAGDEDQNHYHPHQPSGRFERSLFTFTRW